LIITLVRMNQDQFWALAASAHEPADLHIRLSLLPHDELVAFEALHDALVGFDPFRAYLVSRGPAAYADPAGLADPAPREDWEHWMSPTMHAMRIRVGRAEFASGPRAYAGAPA
jgi:hypothetical protein